jgi:hypothetical protein
VERLEGRELLSAGVVAGFTPPIGSNKGSLVAWPAEVGGAVVGLTAPLGSTKGSVVGVAGDDLGTALPDRVVGIPASDASNKEPAYLQQGGTTQGIIAVLIGLRGLPHPTGDGPAGQSYHVLPYGEQDN